MTTITVEFKVKDENVKEFLDIISGGMQDGIEVKVLNTTAG